MPDKEKDRKRFRFRRLTSFSLRTALIGMTVLAVWLGLHMNSVRKQQAAIEAFQRYGGRMHYDYELALADHFRFKMNAESSMPNWLLKAFGRDHFHSVASIQMVRGAQHDADYEQVFRQLGSFPKLERLWLADTQLTDRELRYVGQVAELRILDIQSGYEITDQGVTHLLNLNQLEHLCLRNSQMTDISLRPLTRFSELKKLWIGGNDITDNGLIHLKQLTKLEVLGLTNSNVTEDGLRHLVDLESLRWLLLKGSQVNDASWLQERLPNCRIYL